MADRDLTQGKFETDKHGRGNNIIQVVIIVTFQQPRFGTKWEEKWGKGWFVDSLSPWTGWTSEPDGFWCKRSVQLSNSPTRARNTHVVTIIIIVPQLHLPKRLFGHSAAECIPCTCYFVSHLPCQLIISISVRSVPAQALVFSR